ncbi:MAG TPA: TonB-dependent receptor [Gammaproteobacteria bacterium]|nr:TonB-dependent receptor [Gammaproteobacteria bacterium]
MSDATALRSKRWGSSSLRVLAACVLSMTASAAFGQSGKRGIEAVSPGASASRLDTVVVTASRTETQLASAPAATTVITAADVADSAADDYGDLLRTVPGLNVAQTSARDINVTARGATSTLANSQLALVDGRSLYLDFFGFVAWDLLPVQPQEIERIEVVRGPGSAVWGANAMSGVVNVITKRPRDLLGTTAVLGTNTASVLHAGASENLAYKVSAGYFRESAYPRPTGVIPGSSPPQLYPDFRNRDTRQARANFEVDWDLDRSGTLSVGAGYADTGGILHSGIGPFDVRNGSSLSYVDATWRSGAWRIALAGTFLDGDALNLLTRRGDGSPLSFEFVTDTYDLDVSNTSTLGARNTLTYGVSRRSDDFTLEIAPGASGRRQWSAFVQDELELGARFRWYIGTRYYEDDALAGAALAPRTTLVFSPSRKHSFRVSYNEAFRTPSAINEHLDVTVLQAAGPLAIPAAAVGNPALEEERLKAYEIGYSGRLLDRLALTLDVYRNEISDSIDFFVAGTYGPLNLPAPGPGLPAAVIPCFAFAPGTGPAACPFAGLAGAVPSDYSYRNVGGLVYHGVELGLSGGARAWTWFFNASRQPAPAIKGGIDSADINIPPEWRANLGVARDVGRRFWNASLSYQDKAYWADVLFARAPTDAFTQLNAAAGWRFMDRRLALKISAQNLTDARVQQHIFGDIIERRFEAQVSYEFRPRN